MCDRTVREVGSTWAGPQCIFKASRADWSCTSFQATCAPELNPDEFVWNYLKKQGVSKKPLRRDESLRERVENDLADIKRRPALVRSFFCAPSVAYTKD